MKLCDKIYACRKKAAMTQEALAEALGVSRQTISKWETGMALPELEKLPVMASLFGVSIDWLLSDTEEEIPGSTLGTETEKGPEIAYKQRSRTENGGGYPQWLDSLPKVFVQIIKRFGWLVGVYIAAIGTIFTGLGALGRYIVGKMVSSFSDTQSHIMGGDSWGGFYQEDFFSFMLQGGEVDPFASASAAMENMAQNNPVAIICSVIMGMGILLLCGGVILAVWLKRYSKPSDTIQ